MPPEEDGEHHGFKITPPGRHGATGGTRVCRPRQRGPGGEEGTRSLSIFTEQLRGAEGADQPDPILGLQYGAELASAATELDGQLGLARPGPGGAGGQHSGAGQDFPQQVQDERHQPPLLVEMPKR